MIKKPVEKGKIGAGLSGNNPSEVMAINERRK